MISSLIVTELMLILVLTYLSHKRFNLNTDGDKDHFFCSGAIVESSGECQKIVTVANLVKKCPDTDELAEGLTVGPSYYYNWLSFFLSFSLIHKH